MTISRVFKDKNEPEQGKEHVISPARKGLGLVYFAEQLRF